jgi:hypothetical protein
MPVYIPAPARLLGNAGHLSYRDCRSLIAPRATNVRQRRGDIFVGKLRSPGRHHAVERFSVDANPSRQTILHDVNEFRGISGDYRIVSQRRKRAGRSFTVDLVATRTVRLIYFGAVSGRCAGCDHVRRGGGSARRGWRFRRSGRGRCRRFVRRVGTAARARRNRQHRDGTRAQDPLERPHDVPPARWGIVVRRAVSLRLCGHESQR